MATRTLQTQMEYCSINLESSACVTGCWFCAVQALDRAGLLGEGAQTQILELSPRTMSDILDSIILVRSLPQCSQKHCWVHSAC